MRRVLNGIAAAAVTAAAGVALAHAQGASPEQAHLDHRHTLISGGGVAGVTLARMAGGLIEPQNVPELMRYWALGARLAEDAFEADTRGADIETRAKDAIWENWEDFSSRLQAYAADVEELANLAESGDTDAALAGVRDVLQEHCKDCHDEYRAEE